MQQTKAHPLRAVCVLFVIAATGIVEARGQTADRSAGDFVDRLGQQTISYLKDQATTRDTREERLRGLLRDGFAVEAIGRFVLGKYRRTASPELVNEFVHVFEDYIVSTYASQFSRYSGQSFEVKKALKTTRARDTMVMTHITGKDSIEPLRVDFQVRKQKDSFKIVDIRVEGVSMVLAQRDEFTTYIGNNGGDIRALIDALKKRRNLARADDAR